MIALPKLRDTMLRYARCCIGIGILLSLVACYHVVVATPIVGLSKPVTRAWAHSFLWGMIPPDSLTVCQNNILVRSESKRTFLHGAVSVATLGLYTPVYISVTCWR